MNRMGLLVKVYNDGYPYKNGSIIMRSSITNPVNRYAKNYFLGIKKYSLCLITHEPDTAKMEAWLDDQSKAIRATDIEDKFKLLGVKYK